MALDTEVQERRGAKYAAGFRLSDFFPYRVRIFYRAVTRSIRNIYEEGYGLTVSEWRTMANLNDVETLSASEIVTRSSMDKVNVSRAITSLQKKDMLKRHVDPTDRRRVLLRLTPEGRRVVSEIIPRVKSIESRLLDGLTDAEINELHRIMDKIRDNADRLEQSTDGD